MRETADSIPCLVQTDRGCSVLYRGAYLYSRRDPSSSVLRAVRSLRTQKATLLLCYSPLLSYGLLELLHTLPPQSVLICIEADEALSKLFLEQADTEILSHECFFYLGPADCRGLSALLRGVKKTDSLGKAFAPAIFKHSLSIELSAGTRFYKELYASFSRIAQEAISEFWKNRLTLMHLGRLFSRNILRNLSRLPSSDPFPLASVDRPLVVLGAGPSADGIIDELIRIENRSRYYLLAVDAAARPLIRRGLCPDAIAAVESQFASKRFYAGIDQKPIRLFADLSARPDLGEEGRVSFFLSRYQSSHFLDRIEKLAPLPIIPPLGSVGLVSLALALLLRSHEAVPIFAGGIDFSYGRGSTHCRESEAFVCRLLESHRCSPAEDAAFLFREGSRPAKAKNGAEVYTEPALLQYASVLAQAFEGLPLIFDISPSGLETGLYRVSAAAMRGFIRGHVCGGGSMPSQKGLPGREEVSAFYCTEAHALEEIGRILCSGGDEKALLALLKTHEYLYLHFPDGDQAVLEQSFLNRVRAEGISFLKDIAVGKQLLELY